MLLPSEITVHTHAERIVRDTFGRIIDRWVPDPYDSPRKPSGLAQVNAVLAAIDEALDALGKRQGKREDAACSYLTKLRDRLTAARAAYESLGDSLDGPKSVEFRERIEAHNDALALAQAALQAAPADRAALAECRAEIDVCEARGREIERELVALRSAAALPALPALKSFERAKSNTLSLAAMAKHGRTPARALHAALDQGANYDRVQGAGVTEGGADVDVLDEIRLWACWENDHDVFAWRIRRHEELAPPVARPTKASVTAAVLEALDFTRGRDSADLLDFWSDGTNAVRELTGLHGEVASATDAWVHAEAWADDHEDGWEYLRQILNLGVSANLTQCQIAFFKVWPVAEMARAHATATAAE